MKVTKTLLNPNGRAANYLASQRVDGVLEPVTAIGPTRASAIAMCGIRMEAMMAAMERRSRRSPNDACVVRVPVQCSCCES